MAKGPSKIHHYQYKQRKYNCVALALTDRASETANASASTADAVVTSIEGPANQKRTSRGSWAVLTLRAAGPHSCCVTGLDCSARSVRLRMTAAPVAAACMPVGKGLPVPARSLSPRIPLSRSSLAKWTVAANKDLAVRWFRWVPLLRRACSAPAEPVFLPLPPCL